MGIDEGRSEAIDQCPGPMVVGMPRDKCPKSPTALALISLPVTRGDRTALKVYQFLADSTARLTYVSTYFLQKERNRWHVVEKSITVLME